jgi:hypothetical protein
MRAVSQNPVLRAACMALAGLAAVCGAAAHAAPAQAPQACKAATEFTPRLCRVVLPAVRRVVHDLPDAAATPECRSFRVSPPVLRRVVRGAWQVQDPRGEAALDRGPCAATGRLRFDDGRWARWRYEQVGTLSLWWEAQPAAPRVDLLCTRCKP